ncbi:hypothetical protein ACGK9U_02920 [Mariniflexile sp. HNIBRBA6329]|uniref:hypothetical protein n=1 Tax=Mariniflexile sp. HNIBRBA6329 TaxID=3373088 RepID=UPI0037467E91
MKTIAQKVIFYIFITALVFITSCRTEETESIQAPEDEVLVANSSVASLMQKTSINDGSNDNIIDKANCFNIKLPITVMVNGNSITIKTEEDYKIIEYIFDDDDDDIDTLFISFPITIILSDFTNVRINNYTELYNYISTCNGENEIDDDIECLDFNYPITASLYNSNSEIIESIAITSDIQLYGFIKNLRNTDFVTIKFPIEVTLYDGTQLITNNLNELKDLIETYGNNCDEDDDYDYNDDDCNDCNQDQLLDILTNCSGWSIDKLERYGNDYDDYYDGYTFNFRTDGTVSAFYANNTNYGTYTTKGTGNSLIVTINVPKLPYCNNNWVLHEISKYTETKIDLRVGGNDRMRYKNNCN